MGIIEEVYPLWAFDRRAPVLDNTLTIAGHYHDRAEGVMGGVCGYGAGVGQQEPGEEDDANRNHPGVNQAVQRKQPGARLVRLRPVCGSAGVLATTIRSRLYLAVPEVEFEVLPTPALPPAALPENAIGGNLHALRNSTTAPGAGRKEKRCQQENEKA